MPEPIPRLLDLGQILQRVQKQQAESQESLKLLAEQHKQWQATIVSLLDYDRPILNPSNAKHLPAPKVHEVAQQFQPESGLHHLVSDRSARSSAGRRQSVRNATLQQMVEEVHADLHSAGEDLSAQRKRCLDFVRSPCFEYITGGIIMCNMITIGIEEETTLQDGGADWGVQVERTFLAIYIIELVLRVMAHGIRSLGSPWMLLDLFLVVVGFMSLVFAPLVQSSALDSFDKLMVARGLRLLRLARVLRLSHRFKVVWRLVNGLLTAGGTMLSTSALISLTLFIAGCVAVEIISKDSDLINNPSTGPIVKQYFGSLPRSSLTLLQFVTMDSLSAIYYPLIVEKPYLALFFVPLLILISVCLMNLVTAVLVETSMSFSASEHERERVATKEKIKQALPDLFQLFDEWDADRSGAITRMELEKLHMDVLPDYLVDVMPVESMSELFDLLDVDETNSLTREEFVEGLLHLVLLEIPPWAVQYLSMLRLIRSQLREVNRELARERSLPSWWSMQDVAC